MAWHFMKYFLQNFVFWPICENLAPQKFGAIWYLLISQYSKKLTNRKCNFATLSTHTTLYPWHNAKSALIDTALDLFIRD